MTATRRTALAAAVLAVLATGVAAAAKSWCGHPGEAADLYLRWCYTDIDPLYFFERLHEGAVPYLDHPVEYPVLTGLWMWLAAVPAGSVTGFFWGTAGLLAVSAGVTAWLLAREVGWPRVLAFAAAPTLLVSGVVNWDLPAVALATGGLVAHRRGHDGWAGVLLGLGAAAKLYPALLLPGVALAAWRLRGSRAGITAVGGAAGAWLAVNLPVALAAPEAWWRFFRLSRQRPSDWDALSSVVLRITSLRPSVETLNLVLLALFLAGAAVLLAVAVRRDPPERWHLVGLPVLAWFLLAGKVYSPQFSLWLLPLFALAFPGWRWWAAFAAADVAVTITRFPHLANFVDGGLPGAWDWWPFATALVLRALVLAGAAWSGWRDGGPAPAATPDVPPRPALETP